jgi:RNA polymerase sigma-70 factor, ECF subfamily
LATDRETWERIRLGDVQAFGEVYQAHGPSLEMFLRRLLGSRQAAEDVMQETFARIWQRPNGFEPERGSLRAYLFGAAKKRAADWWRKNDVVREPVFQESGERDNETASLLSDAVARLSEEGRALIWLREVEGYSYDELAQVFDVPSGTVASRLFAAREELRSIWHAAVQQKGRTDEV